MKHIFYLFISLVLAGFFFNACRNAPPVLEITEEVETEKEEAIDIVPYLPAEGESLPVSVFGEIWAYVVAKNEKALTPGLPISDIGYFGADIDSFGSLVDVPDRGKLPAFPGRVHLVVKCDSRTLTHFTLMPGSAERKALIADLLAASRNFDGLQVDFENVNERDGGAFFTFLQELRAGLGNKMFTIALPSRTRKITNDPFDYEKIAPLVDRIVVMAYDQHWSGSIPGSIAEIEWCRSVAAYSLNIIGREKLIMGLPFYGRAWGSTNPSRAYIYTGIETLIKDNNVTEIRREKGIPTFDYEVVVPVRVYYEDAYSLSARMEMYRSMNVNAIGFWRLGQETTAVWNSLRLE